MTSGTTEHSNAHGDLNSRELVRLLSLLPGTAIFLSRNESIPFPPVYMATIQLCFRNDPLWKPSIAAVAYRRIASLIAEKQQQPYSPTLFWLRYKLNFSLLRTVIMCLRGTRSSFHHPARPFKIGEPINLTCSEDRIPLQDKLYEPD